MLLISIWTVAVPLPVEHGMGQRAAVLDPEFLDRAQRSAGGATDVVGPGLEPVELLDDRERHDHVDVFELEHTRGIGDQHRRVEHESRSLPGGPIGCSLTSLPCFGTGRTRCAVGSRFTSGRKQVGQRHSSADGSRWSG